MRKSAFACGLLATVAFSAPVWANDDVIKLSSDPDNWAIQSGDYAGTRYSTLDQITPLTLASLKWLGRSRRAFFAVTKAARW